MIQFYDLNKTEDGYIPTGVMRHYKNAGWVFDDDMAGIRRDLQDGVYHDGEKPLLISDSKQRLEKELPRAFNHGLHCQCEVVPDDFDPDSEPPAGQHRRQTGKHRARSKKR